MKRMKNMHTEKNKSRACWGIRTTVFLCVHWQKIETYTQINNKKIIAIPMSTVEKRRKIKIKKIYTRFDARPSILLHILSFHNVDYFAAHTQCINGMFDNRIALKWHLANSTHITSILSGKGAVRHLTQTYRMTHRHTDTKFEQEQQQLNCRGRLCIICYKWMRVVGWVHLRALPVTCVVMLMMLAAFVCVAALTMFSVAESHANDGEMVKIWQKSNIIAIVWSL